MSLENKKFGTAPKQAEISAHQILINLDALKGVGPFMDTPERKAVWLKDYSEASRQSQHRPRLIKYLACAGGLASVISFGSLASALSSTGPAHPVTETLASLPPATTSTLPPVSSTTTTTEAPPPTTTTLPPTTTTTEAPATPVVTKPTAPLPGPGTIGADLSYPNCPAGGAPTEAPIGAGSFLIVGLNYGHDFSLNNCATGEASQLSIGGTTYEPWIYVNSDYPGPTSVAGFEGLPRDCQPADDLCFAYNYGYMAGVYDASNAVESDLDSDVYLIDVETTNQWDGSRAEHQADLEGEAEGLVAEHQKALGSAAYVGFYSTSYQWGVITGGWQNGLPAWVATGLGSQTLSSLLAPNYCNNNNFTGGLTLAVQYGFAGVDVDLFCK